MKAITTWMFIAASILAGLAGLSANAKEFRVQVTSRLEGQKYLAVIENDGRVLILACNFDVTRSLWNASKQYSADLIFPAGGKEVDEFKISGYKSAFSRSDEIAPLIRPLSADSANSFCQSPRGEFAIEVTDDEAAVITGRRGTSAESLGVTRKHL